LKAAVVSQPGAVPDCTDFADPQAEEGRLLVRPVAVGVHPIVRALAAGAHYGSADGWPMILGLDCVAETREGTLVYTGGTRAPYGTMAELASVPAARATALPAGADPAVIAGALNPGLSTWVPLQHLAGRAQDALVLITGATGGAGRRARPWLPGDARLGHRRGRVRTLPDRSGGPGLGSGSLRRTERRHDLSPLAGA